MNTLTLPSPAKLNLFLHIIGRRPDGYHQLQTVFQLLDYGDQLTFTLRHDRAINLTPEVDGVAHEDNLIVRAARLLQQKIIQQHGNCSLGVDIHLEKKLPMGGGLGGGSSNAATTLLGLNQLWQLQIPITELSELGLQLGADVPVFVEGKSAWAEGIGEQLQAIEIPEKWYLVVEPGCKINTREIFLNKQLTRNTSPITIATVFEGRQTNNCEPIARALFPEVDRALNWLGEFSESRLTGTGACVFANFADENSAQQVLNKLPAEFKGFIAKGVNISPCHSILAG